MSCLTNIANAIEKGWRKKGPKILTSIGVGGIFMLPVLSGIATYDAIQSVEEEKKRLGKDELEPREILNVTWKHYIPTGIGVVVSAGAVIGSNAESMKRNNELMTAFMLSEIREHTAREKTAEFIGKEKESEIYEETVKKQLSCYPQPSYPAPQDKYWTIDKLTGQGFWSRYDIIETSKNEWNDMMILQKQEYVSYSDFIVGCGGQGCTIQIGWRSDGPLIDPLLTTVFNEHHVPCIFIDHKFGNEPRQGYDSIH